MAKTNLEILIICFSSFHGVRISHRFLKVFTARHSHSNTSLRFQLVLDVLYLTTIWVVWEYTTINLLSHQYTAQATSHKPISAGTIDLSSDMISRHT